MLYDWNVVNRPPIDVRGPILQKEVNPSLAKLPLIFSGGSAKLELTSIRE